MAEKCPKCASMHKIKAGLNNYKKQRYKCKACGCHFTRSDSKGYPYRIKRAAIQLYLEGIGLRIIGRTLNISNVTVLNWISSIKPNINRLLPMEPCMIEVVEIDELIKDIKVKHKLSNANLIIILPQNESAKSSMALIRPYHRGSNQKNIKNNP
jgi:transposase-like protein